MKKLVSILIVAVMAMSFLCACGSKKTLENLLSEEDKKAFSKSVASGFSGNGGQGDVITDFKGNDITITATLPQQVDSATFESRKDQAKAMYAATMNMAIEGLEEEYDVSGVTITLKYLNPDGSYSGSVEFP